VLWICIGFNADSDPAFLVNADPDLMTKNWGKLTAEKIYIFFYQQLEFTHPKAYIKDVQATRKVFIPQKRTSRNSNLKFLLALLDLDTDPAD
jgi:hypothetical protein